MDEFQSDVKRGFEQAHNVVARQHKHLADTGRFDNSRNRVASLFFAHVGSVFSTKQMQRGSA